MLQTDHEIIIKKKKVKINSTNLFYLYDSVTGCYDVLHEFSLFLCKPI